MIAKVNFNLVSGENNGMTYLYRTTREDLLGGDVVVTEDQGEIRVGNFIGYLKDTTYEPTKRIVDKAPDEQLKMYWKEVENRLMKEPLWLSDYAYDFYREAFMNNDDTTFEDARKKLTRNVILSRSFGKGKPKVIGDVHVFFYGAMEIRVRYNTIVHIKKIICTHKKFNKNIRKYHYLNEHFGLVGK